MQRIVNRRGAVAGPRALLVALVLGLVSLSVPATARAAGGEEPAIVLIHSNDVHCAGLSTSDRAIGYAGIAQAVNEAREAQGADNVTLIDAGDAIQGQPIGLLTDGEDPVDIMNATAYDLAVPGNHEFDYGIPRLMELTKIAQYPYVSCNVETTSGTALFEPYKIFEYEVGGQSVQVAYVGITTPVTLTSEDPSIFEDPATGEVAYSFFGGNDGQDLYDQVQATVDAARAEGADYVIAVAHLGKDASSSVPAEYTSTAVVANTTGIDGVIDGHTHLIYNVELPNKDGESIPVAQCGTQFQAYGTMTITPDGDPGPEDVTSGVTVAADQPEPVAQDATVAEFVKAREDSLAAMLEEEVGTTEAGLSVYAPDTDGNPWWWVARMRESNLGDFVADAYRTALDSDVALINGGGIRAPQTAITPLSDGTFGFPAGPLTYADLMSVNSFGNTLSLVKVSGQDLLDALEYSVRKLTPAMDDATEATGSFLQVSGIEFTAAVDIPSPVVENADGGFDHVVGGLPRRVSDVTVNGTPIDPDGTYTLATIGLILSPSGDYTMFGDCEYVRRDAGTDYEILWSYLGDDLGGTIGTEAYGNPGGAGRIDIVTSGSASGPVIAVYRLYDPKTEAHLFSVDPNEVQTLVGLGWRNEGICFTDYREPTAADIADYVPVYRLCNRLNGDHLYSTSANEVNRLSAGDWTDEGIAWWAPKTSATPVWRLYDPSQTANHGFGSHLWSTSQNEVDHLVRDGWQDEGVNWYAVGK